MFRLTQIALCLIIVSLTFSHFESMYVASSGDPDITGTIKGLNRRIADLQVQHSRHYIPPLIWAKDRGVYESNIRINTYGKPLLADFRRVGVFDNNAFATAWVTICLLEAGRYGTGAPTPVDEQMKMALELLNSHHDKNRPPGTGAVDFWSQAFNQSSGLWMSQPTNILSIITLMDDALPWDLMEEICKKLGPSFTEVCELLDFLKGAKHQLLPAFKIPADFDDTFVNIGLGCLLKQLGSRSPSLYQLWESGNTEANTVFQLLKTYAYRPLSASLANLIDPRTYYFARGFLEKAEEEGKPVSLATTWMVYENTTSFIEWVIDSGTVTSRPDLALTYYPSRYNFYWFVARTRFLIANRLAGRALPPFPSLRFVYEHLNRALQSRVTSDILAEAKTEGGKWAYFDDFLGGADETWTGKPKNNAEDRLFTTSMAVNALIATWTTQDKATRRLSWEKDTAFLLSRQFHGVHQRHQDPTERHPRDHRRKSGAGHVWCGV
ncbi:uncharacterized protein LOC110979682 isoform X2 [Acanthaster planci]|uniref:Uncharacterized protein LOC110979682 isoform X2 n=1 Tax=Acanthaster planci TaxID=133434 RepID=A0A8B7YFL4_ACAPL|nr:uncharacterized protein LOC110979682 isoform X2 [Acanthaster planci]